MISYSNMQNKIILNVFTDGSCKGNPGIGGWGWISILNNNNIKNSVISFSDWGGELISTNQKMEARAMAEALSHIILGTRANIYTDSIYVLGGIIGYSTERGELELVPLCNSIRGWLNRKVNEKYSKNRLECYKVYNSEKYWKEVPPNDVEWFDIHQCLLEHLNNGSDLRFAWVKGHSNTLGNKEADALANKFAKELK